SSPPPPPDRRPSSRGGAPRFPAGRRRRRRRRRRTAAASAGRRPTPAVPRPSSNGGVTGTWTPGRDIPTRGCARLVARTSPRIAEDDDGGLGGGVSDLQREMEGRARDRLRRPLPARMPLCVSLGTGEFESIFIKLREEREQQRRHEEEGRRPHPPPPKDRQRGGGGGGGGGWGGVAPPFRSRRVLVGSVRGRAGKSGIMKGDVVTHVDGEAFTGNASELNALLARAYEENGGDGVVTIVVNAEECTAEALRLRSLVR
ncbi:hypothetical protein ACHAW5_008023, partial [Stephanodiscus triporus]